MQSGSQEGILGLFQPISCPLLGSYSQEASELPVLTDCKTPSIVVQKAEWGMSTSSIDVTESIGKLVINMDDTKDSSVLGFTNGCNMPNRLFRHLPDPCPGFGKPLTILLEQSLLGTRNSIERNYKFSKTNSVDTLSASSSSSSSSAWCASSSFSDAQHEQKLQMTKEDSKGDSSLSNNNIEINNDDDQNKLVRKTVQRKMVMCEYGSQWLNPQIAVSNGTLSILLTHGLCNQIYSIASAVFVANRTCRSLVFPFRMTVRQKADDHDVLWAPTLDFMDFEFDHLLDSAYFLKNARCALYPSVPLAKIRQDHPSKDVSTIKTSTKHQVDLAYLDMHKNFYPELSARPSSDVPSLWRTTSQHIAAISPMFTVAPTCQEDCNLMIDTILSLRPALRLKTIADKLASSISELVLQQCGHPNFIVVHIRQDVDFGQPLELPTKFWQHFFSEYLLFENQKPKLETTFSSSSFSSSFSSSSSSSSSSFPSLSFIQDSHSQMDKQQQQQGKTFRSKPRVAVYLMGAMIVPEFFAHLKVLANESPFEFVWIQKQQFFDVIPELENIGFEEGGVVDREIALNCQWFYGHAGSSLTAAVLVERQVMDRPCAQTQHGWAAHWLLKTHAKLLFPYSGSHPRVLHYKKQP